jgi:YD repeat-containing protein
MIIVGLRFSTRGSDFGFPLDLTMHALKKRSSRALLAVLNGVLVTLALVCFGGGMAQAAVSAQTEYSVMCTAGFGACPGPSNGGGGRQYIANSIEAACSVYTSSRAAFYRAYNDQYYAWAAANNVPPENPPHPGPFVQRIEYFASGNALCWVNEGQYGLESALKLTSCPANSLLGGGGCQCNPGFEEDAHQRMCVAAPPTPNMCLRHPGTSVGHPILPATAEKFRSEPDFEDHGAAPLDFVRFYRSSWGLDGARPAGALGKAWTHNHSILLLATPGGAPNQVIVQLPEGHQTTFTKPAGASSWRTIDGDDTLVQNADGSWAWRQADQDATYIFTSAGRLHTHIARNGWARTYTYNGDGSLAKITNAFGRSIALTYDSAGQLSTVTAPDASVISYGFDGAGRLTSVGYPDNAVRKLVYENSAFPHALTGIIDETNTRYATFVYDSNGRAISTELAGAVDRYEVRYPVVGQANITDPLGTSRNYVYGTAKNQLAVLSADKPTGSDQHNVARRVQDSDGLISSEVDFNGVTTVRSWDRARRLPTSLIEAVGTSSEMSVTTQWHSLWRLPVKVAMREKSTEYSYDTNGNLLSEAVTDLATNAVRARRWTYNDQGLVATETASNQAITKYGYDGVGNRVSVENALGQTTTYAFDGAGRVIRATLPSGLVSTYSYDLRGRLLVEPRGGLVTTFAYTPNGQLSSSSSASGNLQTYTSDASQRTTGWRDSVGAAVIHTLDAMGNSSMQQTRDSVGNVVRRISRSVDGLNRVSLETLGGN